MDHKLLMVKPRVITVLVLARPPPTLFHRHLLHLYITKILIGNNYLIFEIYLILTFNFLHSIRV